MARLTEKTLAQSSAITPTTLIHIVYTGDPSQNPAGSSYKAELQQLFWSGNCVPDFYVTNIHGCSPINFESEVIINSGITINNGFSANTIVMSSSFTPSGSTDTVGSPGSITWDDDNLYYKTNNGWFVITGSTF
jgi:hypothetical protein